MRSRTLGAAVAVLVALVVASPAQAAPKTTEVLQQFVVSGKGADPEALARAGYDMSEAQHAKQGRLPDHRHAVAGGEARGEGRLGPAARRQARRTRRSLRRTRCRTRRTDSTSSGRGT